MTESERIVVQVLQKYAKKKVKNTFISDPLPPTPALNSDPALIDLVTPLIPPALI